MTPLATMRRHPGAVAGLLVTGCLGWWWTAERMAGMDAGPGVDLGPLGWFTVTWVVMMAGMMLPSLGPALTGYLRCAERRSGTGLSFTGAYLLAWTVAGVITYAVVEFGREVIGQALTWSGAGHWLAAVVIAGAAAYEFVPAKATCLRRCRGQFGAEPWGERTGSVLMGLRSGGWCIGSSGALMAALFALGLMNLTWMILIAGLVSLEKAAPSERGGRLITAAVLAALAAWVVVAPHTLPGASVAHSMGMSAMGQ